jgi:hypothetical protein
MPTPAHVPAAFNISRILDQPDTSIIAFIAFLLGSATALGTSSIYRCYFMRLVSAKRITPNILRRKPWIRRRNQVRAGAYRAHASLICPT